MSDLPADPEPIFNPDDYDDPEPRRGRGFLATDVNIVCKNFVSGEFTLAEGKFLTPYVVARIIKEQDDLEKQPSSGAISRVFHQWEEWGYATFRTNPFAFVDFTEEGKAKGLQRMTEEAKAITRGPR